MLLLTMGPHLYYADPVTYTLKGEIPWSPELRVEPKSFKTFFVHTVSIVLFCCCFFCISNWVVTGRKKISTENLARFLVFSAILVRRTILKMVLFTALSISALILEIRPVEILHSTYFSIVFRNKVSRMEIPPSPSKRVKISSVRKCSA